MSKALIKAVIILITILVLFGCSSMQKQKHKTEISFFNLGMSMVAPGSYYVAHNTGQEIFKKADTVYNKYIASNDDDAE